MSQKSIIRKYLCQRKQSLKFRMNKGKSIWYYLKYYSGQLILLRELKDKRDILLRTIFNRTILQCSLLCANEENCGAIEWDETSNLCTMISTSGLFCDINKINSITANVITTATTLPSSCQGGQGGFHNFLIIILLIYFF